MLHFNHRKYILVEWLPQIIFMESIFGRFQKFVECRLDFTEVVHAGYLVFMIVYKWSTDWAAIGQNPPNLL